MNELPNVKPVYPFYRWNLIPADPDDNKYTDWVVAGKADYLVTQDGYFDILKAIIFPAIDVINIDEFSVLINGL